MVTTVTQYHSTLCAPPYPSAHPRASQCFVVWGCESYESATNGLTIPLPRKIDFPNDNKLLKKIFPLMYSLSVSFIVSMRTAVAVLFYLFLYFLHLHLAISLFRFSVCRPSFLCINERKWPIVYFVHRKIRGKKNERRGGTVGACSKQRVRHIAPMTMTTMKFSRSESRRTYDDDDAMKMVGNSLKHEMHSIYFF